jgi:catechol 2,3-dioxygenase-like lactoylglutathione lyase family enzyme
MRLQHTGLVVRDLERSRRFYGDALGLNEVPRPQNFAFAGAWFQCGDDQIHLLVEDDTTSLAGGPEPGPGAEVGLIHHLAFEVDDLTAACARLEVHGVELFGGPMPRGDGVVQVFVLDPDRHVVELFQWTDDDQSDAPSREPVRG